MPLFSLETLSFGSEVSRWLRAEHLWRIFGSSRVLMTLRHPVGLLESTYRLILRRKNIRMPGGRSWYRTLGEWFEEQLEEEIARHLDYANTLQMYIDLFGRDAVKVVLFEDLRQDPAGFVRSVCEHFQLDPNALGGWSQQRSENRRLSSGQVAGIRRVSRSPSMQRIAQVFRPGVRAWFLRPPRRRPGDRSQRLSPEHRAIVSEFTAEGNRRLEEEFGVPLARHGYPV